MIVSLIASQGYAEPAKVQIDFRSQIRPVLSNSCYECHAGEKQKGGLRLDSKEGAFKGGDTGPLFVAGDPAKSLLIQVLKGARDDIARMPKKKQPLRAEQIELFRQWIQQGAQWPEETSKLAGKKDPAKHWAFTAPVRPIVPKLSESQTARNPIDHFVQARLKQEGLKMAPPANRAVLLRRLSLDLDGLPATPSETDDFLKDKSSDAIRKQVDRLMGSPHFGERWGRLWLDAARYADSDGYEKDKSRTVWHYRDWVVNSFNQDKPYDQFVIEQVAGDLMPNASQDNIVATGFLRNSMINEEGGVDPEQFRMDAMFDRMDCVGKSVLGLTIQCAQCHDHKYDPLKQEEYYRMFAFLNNDYEAQKVVYQPDEQMKLANLARQMKDLEESLRHTTPDWESRMNSWEDNHTNAGQWTVLRPTVDDISTGGQKYLPQPDGSFLAQSYAPTKHTGKFTVTNDLASVTAFRLELLTDANLPCNGPGRSFKGTCALTEFKVFASPLTNPAARTPVKFSHATADVEQPEMALESNFDDKSGKKRMTGPVQMAIDGKDDTAWGIDVGPGRRNQERKAVFECATNYAYAGGTIYVIELEQNHGGWNSDDHMNNNLGRFRLSLTSSAGPQVADPIPERVRTILKIPRADRSDAQKATVFSYWRTTVPEFKEANGKIEALWRDWPSGSTTLALMAREKKRDTHILKRGDWLKPEKSVGPGTPAFLHPLKPENPTRLDFARWLVDKKSPTTARAIVNRIWQAYFGTGLMNTPEDFGMQSDTPSHPELLDWLACELMDHNWSLKHIHHLIVESATYQQDSRVTPEGYASDPYNRLLARGPRFRVDAEIVRDIALSSSGLLNPAVGGPAVFSPAPEFLFLPPASYAPFTWKEETGENRYRRALYTFRRRSTPYPALQVFDAPNGDFSCVRRMRSNTPLQALVTLNETVFIECARALAKNILRDGGATDGERINYAFRKTLARMAADDERQELLSLIEKQKKRIAEGWVNPNEVATGENKVATELPKGTTPAQLAAYTVVSRVLLNLDETLTKE